MIKGSRCSELDNDLCVKNAGGNRFDLIILASVRAREISERNKNSEKFEHLHSPVSALLEIQEGKIGAEYLKKVR
jgi:DNA-directed RNA polymerase omega subunit